MLPAHYAITELLIEKYELKKDEYATNL